MNHVFLEFDQELRDIKSSMKLHYLKLDLECPPNNDVLFTRVKYGLCRIGLG